MTLRLLLVCCLALSAQLAGQTLSVHGRIAFPLSSSQLGMAPGDSQPLQRVIDRTGGVWAGLAVDARAARFSATVSGLRSLLNTSDDRFPERAGGEISAVVRYEPRRTVALEARHSTRVFSSAAGRQSWGMWGLGIVGSLNLGTPLVRASGGFTYLPIIRVSDVQDPTSGIGADLALSVTPRATPLVLTVGYRIEKFTFPHGSARAEQFEALTLSLGLRLQRRDGRWALGEP